jgi:hypothetical protein
LKLKKLIQEASTRLEVNSVALRLVAVAVTVMVGGRIFVEECVVSNGDGRRLFWRENIVMVETIEWFLVKILVA